MRVLGIDPGSAVTGWGVIEIQEDGHTMRHQANGCIRAASEVSFSDRLSHIFHALDQIITEHLPDVVSVETVFTAKNMQSALKLGHARGVAIAAASRNHLPVSEYSALQIKKTVVGFGRAEKKQVQEMVRVLLSLAKNPAQDAADALAAAICHGYHHTTATRLAGLKR